AGVAWAVWLVAASTPVLVPLAITPVLWRRFPVEPDHVDAVSSAKRGGSGRTTAIVRLMVGIGALMALAWASISQFLIPLRGAREFGLDRGGVSMLLATSHLVDLAVLLPVGWLADRVGRLLVLGGLTVCVGFAVWGAGLGGLPLFITGCVVLGVGMAGWVLPPWGTRGA